MMENGILPEADFSKALEIINRNAYGLKRLINDLLDMSAILNGKMQMEEVPLRVAEVVSESVESMRSFAHHSGVKINLEVADEANDVTMKGDRARLNQAFCNILHNAIKFSPAGSEVSVTCKTDEANVIVRVDDKGEGIEPEFLPSVFERFRQADGSRSRSHGGLGLGLALVESFVTAHGGTVAARSEGRGAGSSFVIKLPIVKQTATHGARSLHQTDQFPSDVRTKILIVEDQPDTLEMLAAQFRVRGYDVLACTTAAEALKISEEQNFEALISDVAMPEMDGLQLIKKFRSKEGLKRIPAIALSGYASEKDAQAALAAGFDLHVAKPVDPTDLAAAVERLLRSRG